MLHRAKVMNVHNPEMVCLGVPGHRVLLRGYSMVSESLVLGTGHPNRAIIRALDQMGCIEFHQGALLPSVPL